MSTPVGDKSGMTTKGIDFSWADEPLTPAQERVGQAQLAQMYADQGHPLPASQQGETIDVQAAEDRYYQAELRFERENGEEARAELQSAGEELAKLRT